MAQCTQDHRYDSMFTPLPDDQGGKGRHRCAGCAYDRGYKQGLQRDESPTIELDSVPESQAGSVRHQSPHAAWALGYLHGVHDSY